MDAIKLSQEEYFTTLTDYLINNVPKNGLFDAKQQMIGCDINANDYAVGNDIKQQATMNDYGFIVYYAAREKGLIYHPKENGNKAMFALTDLGKEVKERNGICNWENFEKGEESVPFENIKWMQETAEATRDAAEAAKTSQFLQKELSG